MSPRRRSWATVTSTFLLVVLHGAAAFAAPPDGAQVDRTVRRILDRAEYAGARRSWWARLRDEVRSWFLEQLARLFGSGAGNVVAWLLVGTAAVVLLLLVVRVVRTYRRSPATDGDPRVTVLLEQPPSAWVAQAQAARGRGDHAEAVRCAYRAVVAQLALRGAVDEVPGRTVGEYRRQVQRQMPALREPFARASAVFERVWYAQRPAGDGDVATVLAVADDVGVRP